MRGWPSTVEHMHTCRVEVVSLTPLFVAFIGRYALFEQQRRILAYFLDHCE